MDDIIAKAHYTRSHQLRNVTCVVEVGVKLRVTLVVEEDGSFDVVGVKDDDLIEISADAVRDAVAGLHSDDAFADAYTTALEVEL